MTDGYTMSFGGFWVLIFLLIILNLILVAIYLLTLIF